MKKEDEKEGKMTLILNNNLPNYFVDNARIALRDDGICYINFFTGLPEGGFEQTRIMTPTDRLKHIVDTICEHLDHYPVKMEENETLKTKETPKTKEKKRSPKKT